jgi:hypothetical protein
LHLTPTSAGWLNLVERWHALLVAEVFPGKMDAVAARVAVGCESFVGHAGGSPSLSWKSDSSQTQLPSS